MGRRRWTRKRGSKATNAQRGTWFEDTVRRKLRKAGWWVIRAGGSQGEADLVVIAPSGDECSVFPEVALVQCKTNGRLDPGEWDALYELAEALCASPVLAFSEEYGKTRRIRFLELQGRKKRGKRMNLQDVEEWNPQRGKA